jgi:hypothetical protein
MKGRWAAIVGKARQIESAIQTRIEAGPRAAADGRPRQPLEVVHAIVQSVEREIQPAGRGRFLLPYTRLRVWIAAASARDRARFEAACEGPPSLEDRIADRLSALHCDAAALDVKLTFVTAGRPDWIDPGFHLEYARMAPATADPASSTRIELTVLAGSADRPSYAFGIDQVSIGRGSEVRDSRDRLIRTNQVAFVEGGGDVNGSVSRRHAHIRRDAADGSYRLYDDGASQGTSVIRDGRDVPVTRARGLRLRSGDVIVLGQARLRVRMHETRSRPPA